MTPARGEVLARAVLRPGTALAAGDVGEFLAALSAGDGAVPAPIERALLAGTRADRLGFAFAAGYTSALSLLGGASFVERGLRLPELRACFAATESAGAHPRAIATTLLRDADGLRLDGRKSWVTLGHEATRAIVIAREGELEGRPVLKAVLVPLSRAGVTLEPTPAPPFVPEIGHASLRLDAVRIEEADVLDGDGYADWLKPFRTIEDLCVHAALVGYLAGVVVRAGGPSRAAAELVAIAVTLQELAEGDTRAATTHVVLEGVLGLTHGFIERHAALFAALPEAERDRWERDRPLLGVAGRARGERFARALASLAEAPP